MKLLKLRTKIILFTTLLLISVVTGSFLLIDHVVRDQVRTRLVHDLERSQHTLEQIQKDRLRELVAYSTIASENSTLKAAIETFQSERQGASPILDQLRRTVENEAHKLFTVLATDLLIITDNTGQVLTAQSNPSLPVPPELGLATQPSVLNSLSLRPKDFVQAASIWRFRDKVYRIVSVPILLQDFVVGTLNTGFEINPSLLQSIKANTDSDVVFFADGGIIASTLGSRQNLSLLNYLQGDLRLSQEASTLQSEMVLAGETFLALKLASGDRSSGDFVILNSIDQAMIGIMKGIKKTLVLIGILSIVLATLLGWALSRSITQPLMTFVNFMDGISQSGDLRKRFEPQSPNFEVDVLARSYESLARSLEESQAQTAKYHQELRQKESNEEKLRTLAARSRLDALISQINPHFLFNALNTVSVLIDENPAEAQRLTLKLSNIFRQTLQASGREIISLQEELNFIHDYLEIEKARFGDRLQVEERVMVDNAEVPCFTLQALVENAIKHGASPKIGTTTIEIQVHQTNDRLKVEVSDDGMGMHQDSLDHILERGYGLKNLVDRLNIQYEGDFSWRVESQYQKGTTVRLELPCHRSDQGSN
jgi:sensor histidine kinase YesM